MDDCQLQSLVGRTNAATLHGRPPGTLLVDDFEVVPGFSGEVVTVHLIRDPDGWKEADAEFPPETVLWTYTIRARSQDGAADEPIVVPAFYLASGGISMRGRPTDIAMQR